MDGLVAQFYAAGDSLICPVLDARKKEVYCGFYKCDEQGIPELQGEYQVISPEILCEKIDEPVVLLGDGAEVFGDLFRKKLAGFLRVASPGTYFPRAATIGLLASAKWKNEEFLDPATAAPIYIRASEAELLFGK